VNKKLSSATPTLNLVRFQGNYFPLSEADYQLLREYEVVSIKMRESTLEILKATVLKGKPIEVHAWADTYPMMRKGFLDSLPEGVECACKTNTITFAFDDEHEEVVTQSINLLAHYSGRYGIRVQRENKQRKGYQLARLTLIPDEDIVPSSYFTKTDTGTPKLEALIQLSNACRLRLSKRAWVSGEPVFAIDMEEMSAGNFSPTFSRSFRLDAIDEDDLHHSARFFAELSDVLNAQLKKRAK